ncbi:MAG: Nramp family divalent metal transporter, partial [Chryseobacterium sp.]|nr:Nramp family divalent metal transporter [Chryseobacterium sp.]
MSRGWRKEKHQNSLSEVFSSINIPQDAGFWKKLLAFTGPGLMVAVGYMDPGNWATDIAGGAKFGYTLLSVILISNIFAIILQHLAVKLGVVAERDLAQACRDHFKPTTNFILWVLCEIAIAACDLAEVIGSAIALNLLFGIPLTWGIAITGIDVFIILLLQSRGFRWIEAFVAGLIFVIFACFGYEIIASKPDLFPLLKGLIPTKQIVYNPSMLYIAIGILGATVMPHNLYLHSSIVQTRNYKRNTEGKKMAIKFATIDSTFSLFLAFFVNAAILIVAAATFHNTGYQDVADIFDAHKLLDPLLGTSVASVFFAIALLASGQNSTLTGTLAGQIVMEGFLNIKLKPWLRRLITRLIAIVPALIIAILYGEKGTTDLLVLSQVILSMQLSFAVIPLVMFTNSKAKMGEFA